MTDFVERLRAQGARYHNLHPFHQRMDAGELSREELRRWVTNRFYYQKCIPLKDAAILANCPEVEVRRAWIQRILDHDGTAEGTGGTESWLVSWVDDPADQTGGADDDGRTEDYRHILVRVGWAQGSATDTVALTTVVYANP